MPWVLLQITREHNLARTHALLLGEHFSVCETRPEDALATFHQADFDGVILCSSLNHKECVPLIEKLTAFSPSLPIFRIAHTPHEEPFDHWHSYSGRLIFIQPFEPQGVAGAVQRIFLPQAGKPPARVPPGRDEGPAQREK